jgi:hypothetical protein
LPCTHGVLVRCSALGYSLARRRRRAAPPTRCGARSRARSSTRPISRCVQCAHVCVRACVRALAAARSHTRYTRLFGCLCVCLVVCVFECLRVCPQRRLGLFDELVALLRELGGFAGEKAHKLAPHNAALSQQAKQLCVRPPLLTRAGTRAGTREVLARYSWGYSRGARRVIAGYLRGTHSMPSSCAPAGVRPPTAGARARRTDAPLHPAHAPLGGCGADAQRALSGRQ